MARRSSILKRINSRLSYTQKYLVIVFIFAAAFTFFAFTLLQMVDQNLKSSNLEQLGSRYEKPIRKLMENIFLHKELVISYHKGKTNVKNDLVSLQALIADDFRKLDTINKELDAQLKTREQDLYPLGKELLQPNQLFHNWEKIKKQTFDSDFATLNPLYDELIFNILSLIDYINTTSHLILDNEAHSFFLVEGALVQLPETQQALSSLLTISELALEKKEISFEEKMNIAILKDRILHDFETIQKYLSKSIPAISKSSSQQDNSLGLETSLGNFLTRGNKFLSLVDVIAKSDNPEQLPPGKTEDLSSYGTKALEAGFSLWDVSNSILDDLLEERVDFLLFKRRLAIFIGAFISFFGFFLGLFFINEVIRSVKNLDETISRLGSGDLTARVPVLYNDEIGRVSFGFNRMADSFEKIITQLRNLLDATKRLSDGDFTARVSVEGNADDEICQIGLSFNNMAQSFEEIIGQLHQLGINLTTSATEIAAASKQQETIIVEQEATTREISVTANEISTTAKEFASTVSEVSKVGEETSTLALAGKDSLSHMEAIMRQMVDASGSIASKLAVLNEKAGNITSVITTITKVADQTNLLSLNAAIEAEKAGEYGRSFSVIAREIRRLADQTALATLDIEKIVNEIMSAVSSSVMGVDDFTQEIRNGVQQVEKVGEQLATIIEQVQVLTKRFETVNQGMQTQSAAAGQINEAMAQLSHTARLTTESIHQFRNTIQQLNGAATDLRVAVSKMKR